MLVGDFNAEEFEAAFSGDGIRVGIGPFVISIRGDTPEFIPVLQRCYSNYPRISAESFADARVSIESPKARFWKQSSEGTIRLNEGNIYSNFPNGSELPYVEWGINLCIATRAHHFLMLHSGVLEKSGVAMMLPGLPGAGKSTLCAYLMNRGWRLLSDEFTLLMGPDLEIHPFPRLIPLKNESINVIRNATPEAQIGPLFEGTPKGTVAHVSPKRADVERMDETAIPKLVIFPKYEDGAKTQLVEDSKPRSFVELTKHAFNYILRGKSAFEMTAKLVDESDCYRLVYCDLPEAAARIDTALEKCVANN